MGLIKNALKRKIEPRKNAIYMDCPPQEEKILMAVGNEYECRIDTRKRRKDVIKKLHIGDFIEVKPYKYKNSTAFMFVDPRSRLDIGVIGSGSAEYIRNTYELKDLVMLGEIVEILPQGVKVLTRIYGRRKI